MASIDISEAILAYATPRRSCFRCPRTSTSSGQARRETSRSTTGSARPGRLAWRPFSRHQAVESAKKGVPRPGRIRVGPVQSSGQAPQSDRRGVRPAGGVRNAGPPCTGRQRAAVETARLSSASRALNTEKTRLLAQIRRSRQACLADLERSAGLPRRASPSPDAYALRTQITRWPRSSSGPSVGRRLTRRHRRATSQASPEQPTSSRSSTRWRPDRPERRRGARNIGSLRAGAAGARFDRPTRCAGRSSRWPVYASTAPHERHAAVSRQRRGLSQIVPTWRPRTPAPSAARAALTA